MYSDRVQAARNTSRGRAGAYGACNNLQITPRESTINDDANDVEDHSMGPKIGMAHPRDTHAQPLCGTVNGDSNFLAHATHAVRCK